MPPHSHFKLQRIPDILQTQAQLPYSTYYTKKLRRFKENWTTWLEGNSWIMKSSNHIIIFFYNFSTIPNTIGALDQSCQPAELSDLPDALQRTCTTHSTNITSESHTINLLQLTCTRDTERIVTGLCWAWSRHDLMITDAELNEWENNGVTWQRLRWSSVLAIT